MLVPVAVANGTSNSALAAWERPFFYRPDYAFFSPGPSVVKATQRWIMRPMIVGVLRDLLSEGNERLDEMQWALFALDCLAKARAAVPRGAFLERPHRLDLDI